MSERPSLMNSVEDLPKWKSADNIRIRNVGHLSWPLQTRGTNCMIGNRNLWTFFFLLLVGGYAATVIYLVISDGISS